MSPAPASVPSAAPPPLILLVDDSPDQLKLIAGILESLACRIITATSGSQALAIALRERPDLILLDILMPGLDGLAVLGELKRNPETQDGPVIFLTSKTEQEDIVAGLEAGAADYVMKPFHGTELIARVRNHLEFKQTRDQQRQLIRELQDSVEEVRLLSGLIPICSHCKKIRDDSGYWQQVEDYVSRLSTVQFSHGLCPGCAPIASANRQAARARPASRPEPAPVGDAPPAKVLVVDDSPSNIRTLIQFLREDYKLLVATNGQVALELAANERPDIILLDVMMPEMDGHEVCQRLKQDPRTRQIPVIFVTAQTEEGGELKGFDLGAVDYIPKPFSLSIVRARLKNHLELKRYRDELERQSTTDGLTGLPNRRYLETYFDLAWNQAQRARSPISVILADVDQFKTYNDHYGHLMGDDCLKTVARTMTESLGRKSDLVARFGGEEFLCVLPATEIEGAKQVAEELRARVEALALPHAASGLGHVTISLGVASIVPGPSDREEDLIEQADQALYEAKHAGRNRWTVFTGPAVP